MKNVKIELNQSNVSMFAASFDINDNQKVSNAKLTESITKAVFKRYDAQVLGLRTGLKVSKPFMFRVIINNEETVNTDALCSSTGMNGKIKINNHTYKKCADDAKSLFQRTLLYVIEANTEFNADMQSAFE